MLSIIVCIVSLTLINFIKFNGIDFLNVKRMMRQSSLMPQHCSLSRSLTLLGFCIPVHLLKSVSLLRLLNMLSKEAQLGKKVIKPQIAHTFT